MVNELDIPLPIEYELLSLCLFVSLDLLGPLLLKHMLLSLLLVSVNSLGLGDGVLLPGEDVEGFLDLLFLQGALLLFSLNFLLVIEHPKFGVDLLLNDGLLQLLLFVHELLFSFDLGSGNHEGSLLPSQVVGLHFEFSLKGVLHLLGSLLFPLLLQGVESLGHLGSDLLWSFKGSHEFLFINLILCG